MKSTHTNTNTNKHKYQLKDKVFTYHKVAKKYKIDYLQEVPGKLSPHTQIPKVNINKYKQTTGPKFPVSKKRENTAALFGKILFLY